MVVKREAVEDDGGEQQQQQQQQREDEEVGPFRVGGPLLGLVMDRCEPAVFAGAYMEVGGWVWGMGG